MLLNVDQDTTFQRYLDRMEQRLHARLVPLLTAGIHMQMSRGSLAATNYVNERGEPILIRHYRAIYEDAFDATVDQIEKAARTGKSAFMREQLSYLEREAAKQIQGVSRRNADRVHNVIMAGMRDGKTYQQIARQLNQQIPDLTKGRSARIARTETHNAAMSAIYETAKFKRVPVKSKTWWTAQDNKVRESHAEVHGVTVPFDEPFEVGDSLLMFPGDTSLGAGADEIANCRCSNLFRT